MPRKKIAQTINLDGIDANKPPETVVMIEDDGLEEHIEILVSRENKSWIVQIWNRLEETFSTKRSAERFIRSWLKNELQAHERVAHKIEKVLR
jgi:hypothetical protein